MSEGDLGRWVDRWIAKPREGDDEESLSRARTLAWVLLAGALYIPFPLVGHALEG